MEGIQKKGPKEVVAVFKEWKKKSFKKIQVKSSAIKFRQVAKSPRRRMEKAGIVGGVRT